jgi:hypothetical protein
LMVLQRVEFIVKLATSARRQALHLYHPPSQAHQLIYLTLLMLHRMTHVVVSLVIILVLVRILSDAVPVVIPETFSTTKRLALRRKHYTPDASPHLDLIGVDRVIVVGQRVLRTAHHEDARHELQEESLHHWRHDVRRGRPKAKISKITSESSSRRSRDELDGSFSNSGYQMSNGAQLLYADSSHT